MLRVEVVELPPPGAGLKTVTAAVPAAAMSLARIWALSVGGGITSSVVGRSLPFHRTTELATKFEPHTDKVKACPPTGAQLGSRELIVGMGFAGVVLIAKFKAFDVPPPGAGLKTVTAAAPVAAISVAEIWAASWLLLIKVVGRSLPFHRTTKLDTKFEPNTVKVKAGPPTVVLVGERLVIVGVVPLGEVVEAVEPHPHTPAPMTTAISTPTGTNLRMPIVLMATLLNFALWISASDLSFVQARFAYRYSSWSRWLLINLPVHSGDAVAGCQADVEDFFASIDDHKVTRNAAVKVQNWARSALPPACRGDGWRRCCWTA
jgi:hypothetical protein